MIVMKCFVAGNNPSGGQIQYHARHLVKLGWQLRGGKHLMRSVSCGAGFDPESETKKTKPSQTSSSLTKEGTLEAPSEDTKPSIDLDDSEIEARLLQRRLRRKRKTESEFQVDTDKGPETDDVELERNVIYVLGSLFSLIIINGIIIAASGFLPESVDKFVGTYLYPSFSPIVGVFLAGSTLYGIWKTRSEKKDT